MIATGVSSRTRAGFLACVALTAILPSISAYNISKISAYNVSKPGILEVDLIFPCNESYSPVELFPMVFAIQNPILAYPLQLNLEWSLAILENNNSNSQIPTIYNSSNNILSSVDLSYATSGLDDGSNPYFYTSYFQLPVGVEYSWQFTWRTLSRNCTVDGQPSDFYPFQEVFFATVKGADSPDIGAATAAQTCGSIQNAVINVTNPVEYTGPEIYPTCAAFGPPPATANPCAVTLDSTAASRIWASATASFCAVQSLHPGSLSNSTVDCPPLSTGHAARSDPGLTIWMLAIFSGFVCMLLL